MSTVTQVRTAFATALNGMSGLRCNAEGYVQEKVSPPEAMVDYRVNPHLTFGPDAPAEYEFSVVIYVSRSSTRAAQKLLDGWRDPGSVTGIRYVLENDAGLAALVHYVRVGESEPVDAVDLGGAQLLRVSFPVEVVF